MVKNIGAKWAMMGVSGTLIPQLVCLKLLQVYPGLSRMENGSLNLLKEVLIQTLAHIRIVVLEQELETTLELVREILFLMGITHIFFKDTLIT